MQPPDPSQGDDLFTHTVDTAPVHFVRPDDTDRPTWAAYQGTHYLGTVHAQFDLDGRWHVQTLRERHHHLDDAIRALRRPTSWPVDHARARHWAHSILEDRHLVVIDVQTTALTNAWAVQIACTDRAGEVLFDELINPLADIAPEAAALHGISPPQLAAAPTFGTLLPGLTHLLAGRHCLAYNASFDRGILERELDRLPTPPQAARAALNTCSWHDAMAPYAAWRGLWSTRRRAYRYQPLGSAYDAVANCHLLLETVQQMTRSCTLR